MRIKEKLSKYPVGESNANACCIGKAKEVERIQQEQAGNNYIPSTGGNVVSGNGYFTHPCPGMSYQSSYFGEIRPYEVGGHKGHDYAAAVGTPTYAAAAGNGCDRRIQLQRRKTGLLLITETDL